jgi:uncharacterized membrane protein
MVPIARRTVSNSFLIASGNLGLGKWTGRVATSRRDDSIISAKGEKGMAFCANCGAPMAEGTSFCSSCGAPVGGAPPAAPSPASTGLTSNVAGALAYFTFIPAIIFLVVDPYKDDKFVRFHSFQSIFFWVVLVGFSIVWGILMMILGFVTVGLLTGLLIMISRIIHLGFVCVGIFLMYKAYQNERYQAPIIGALAAKQAGL